MSLAFWRWPARLARLERDLERAQNAAWSAQVNAQAARTALDRGPPNAPMRDEDRVWIRNQLREMERYRSRLTQAELVGQENQARIARLETRTADLEDDSQT